MDLVVDRTGLVGRATELAVAAAFVDAAAGDGAALLLTGEPGVGKTALLNATAELAIGKGLRVLSGAGAEYETEVSFSGLHQLVSPLTAELALLPQASRAALEVALGSGTGPAPTEMAVLHAALSLFVEAARAAPLLLVVDDLHALDRASRSVLSFVGRRARGHRIALLAAVRTGIAQPPDRIRLPELPVAPLTDADAIRLLSRRFSGLSGRVIAEVARHAQGNPLALLEFGAHAGAPQLLPGDGAEAGSGPAREVLALYAARVARLPAGTRELLLLAALEGSGDLGVLETAAGTMGLDALAAAERDHLICTTADGRRVRFRHPLVRSAVVGQATLEQRRAAHRRLAVVLADQPERRADHLSMATTVADEPVAEIIEAGARRSLRRGDVLGAVARLRRAAALSADRELGGRRLAHAAYIGASVAGDLELSERLMRELDDCEAASPPPSAVAAAGYWCLMTDGDAETAHRLLTEVVDPRTVEAGADMEELSPALFTLMLACHYAGRPANWAPLRDLAFRFPYASPSSPVSLVRILADVGSVPDQLLRDLDDQLSRLDEVTDAGAIIRTALAASYLDRLAGCQRLLTRSVRDARDSGTVGGALPSLVMSALGDLYAGRWSQAQATAEEVRRISRATGYHLLCQVGHHISAMVAAHRGDLPACAAHSQALLEWGADRNLGRLGNWAHQARARAALGSSDFESAFREASAITVPGELPPFNLEALATALDLVEAALYSGRADEARRHAAAVRDAGLARISPRLALMTATVTAMTSEPPEMTSRFEAALALPGIEEWPFDVARTHLVHGQCLRRLALKTEARPHLAAARDGFEQLGALRWKARAAAELRATGVTRFRDVRPGAALTPQEFEVAQLAAAGLSTKQIAARMVLSPRTVSAHLYRTFPKLGINSRAALRDALTGLSVGGR